MYNKSRGSMAISIIFVLIIASFGVLNFIMHTDKKASKEENRILAQFPKWSLDAYFSGEYMVRIDEYLKDQFFIRDFCINLSKNMEKFKGFGYSATISGQNTGGNGSNQKLNYYYVDEFCFYNFMSKPDMEMKYADTIEQFASMHDDINVYNMLIPNSVAYVDDELKKLSDSPFEAMDLIKGNYKKTHFIDVRDEFSKYGLKQLYFKTDHHWNGDGVYAAYAQFCKELGFNIIPKQNMGKLEYDNMLGSLYFMTKNEKMKTSPDTLVAYKPIQDVLMTRYYKNDDGGFIKTEPVPFCVSAHLMGENPSYGIYLGGDMPLCVISRTDVVDDGYNTQGNNVIIVKDSFGNAFSTIITPHYDNVHIIDPRSWDGNLYEYAKKVGAKDIIFINTTSTATSGDFIQSLQKLF